MTEFVNAFEVKEIEPEPEMFRVTLQDLRGEKVELRVQEDLKDKLVIGSIVKMYLEI
ncbi:MAG: hypothetical protein JSV43_00990 [Methanobacteriota archaeon]|nr:MAG: hypothetical protein JSV43_00990 [Euryarchaeota archaeon]